MYEMGMERDMVLAAAAASATLSYSQSAHQCGKRGLQSFGERYIAGTQLIVSRIRRGSLGKFSANVRVESWSFLAAFLLLGP
jgi:hypothetical protein